MKVLLISPTDPDKPGNLKFLVGGENTYTRTLLKNPPKGVVYTYHLEALKNGLIEYLPLHGLLQTLVKFRILPLSGGTQAIRIKGDFDLVHCHGYSLKIESKKEIPIVMSDSSSNYLFLRDYINWPEWRIKIGYWIRRQLFGWLGVIDCDTNWEKAKKIIVFSKFAKKVHRALGVPVKKMEVVYPGIQKREVINRGNTGNKGDGVNILFVGIWFERKGGPLLLEAFTRLSRKYPNITLTIVGPIPKRMKDKGLRMKNYEFVPRKKLMGEIFPKADIFVLVPPFAEGFGFAVLEAMSFGIPAVVTRVYALSEIVDDARTGFVIDSGSLTQLTEKLEELIKNKDLRRKMGERARDRFMRFFTSEKQNEQLSKVYRQVLGEL